LTYSEIELAGSMWKGRMIGSDQLAMEESVHIVKLLGQCVETVKLQLLGVRQDSEDIAVAVPRFDEELTSLQIVVIR
jgi:hypothetical protein